MRATRKVTAMTAMMNAAESKMPMTFFMSGDECAKTFLGSSPTLVKQNLRAPSVGKFHLPPTLAAPHDIEIQKFVLRERLN